MRFICDKSQSLKNGKRLQREDKDAINCKLENWCLWRERSLPLMYSTVLMNSFQFTIRNLKQIIFLNRY